MDAMLAVSEKCMIIGHVPKGMYLNEVELLEMRNVQDYRHEHLFNSTEFL